MRKQSKAKKMSKDKNKLAYLCNQYRTEIDPTSLAFATVAESRTDQSYLASQSFPEDSLMETSVIMEIVNNYGKQSFLRDLDSRRDAFVRFLRSLNAAISSPLPQNYVSCSIESGSPEEGVIFHLYCLIACKLYYSDATTSFHHLGSFVANLATRIYRIPKSARIMRGVAHAERFRTFAVDVASQSNEYAILLSCFNSASDGKNYY
jgi:hypothetical protein